MKRFKSAICGTLLALSVTLASAWAQDASSASPDDKPSPAIQEEQTGPPPQQEEPSLPPQRQNGPPPPPDGQSLSTDPNAPEPPSRVARLQYMSGSVSIQPQGTGDWAAGVLNRPLTSSDNIWTDKDSRAELNVGGGLIRMDSESSLTLTGVTDNSTQLELHQGSLSLHVRDLAQGETYEIDTPNTAFTLQTPGDYRVDVNSNGNSSLVTVWRGEGQASTNGSGVDIKAGQQARFGDGSSGNGDIAQAGAPDSFDTWCQGRDQRGRNSVSARYVSPDVIGSEDLDEYGTWRDTPDYGEVWTPSAVPTDWAPYHYGNWAWVAPWGWTWVDDEPWGFAPFHYGRWVYGGGYWGWSPGPYWGRPFYAPALVGWFGGAGWGFGLGFGFGGGIGWCPLGWGEPFFPWYHSGWGYFNRVNIYNTRINNIGRFREGFGRPGFGAGFHYANLNAPGGRFAVSQRVFANSMSVRNQGVRMSASQFERGSLGARVPVSPTRASRLGGGVGRAAAVPPARAFSRATVSRASLGSNARVANRGTSTASFARSNGGAINSHSAVSSNRGFSSASASSRYVPRPPSSTSNFNRGAAAARTSSGYRSSSSATNRSYGSQNYGSRSYRAQNSARGGNSNYVPRPSGPARSSEYASNGYRGYSSPSYSSRGSYGNSYGGSYGSNRSYGENSGGSYRSYPGAASRSYSQPSYRSYSAAPSYRGYSAPSSRGYSGRSYSAPSYHGSSGGGHSYSGGGGGHYSGGGGGHSSGGGGGHGGGGRR